MKNIFLFLCILSCHSIFAQVKFNLPLKGKPGKDFYIVNYVDHDTTTNLRDPFCGDKTYDGHTGTDMVLRSWKLADSGVGVYAAADGVVYLTKDGMYDRNKHKNTQGFGNFIAINHNFQLFSYYAHLRKGSLKVKYGDSVKAGQLIGLVACSGNCTDPHLHFEVYDYYSNLLDPFSGPCQKNASLWNSQPLYDTSTKLIETGFVPYEPNLDTLRERYLVRDTFTLKDTIVCFWALMQGLKKGDSSRVDWYTPGGTFWYSYGYAHSSNLWYAYTWTYINRPPSNMPGTWEARYYVKIKLITSQKFYFSTITGTETNLTNMAPLRIFPNPAGNEINIENMPHSPSSYFIYDARGSMVQSGALSSNMLYINKLAKGNYTLEINGLVCKFIKN